MSTTFKLDEQIRQELVLFLNDYLVKNNLTDFDVDFVTKLTITRYQATYSSLKLCLLKTVGIEVIGSLKKQSQNRKNFEDEIERLFHDKDPQALHFCASIARHLKQFRLSRTYDVKEIIAEAYSIGIKKIAQDEYIYNPRPWLRTTCLNVIREFKRQQRKSASPRFDVGIYMTGDDSLEEMQQQEDLKAMQLAFERLNLEERQLLKARCVDNLQWNEIAQLFSETPGTLRQRGARALKKLRKNYDPIRDYIKLPEEDTS
ncbi:MAG: sigma-70 family RNA polymerase sigma factor [Cyanobacteria bacterium P01_D01_bin.56]